MVNGRVTGISGTPIFGATVGLIDAGLTVTTNKGSHVTLTGDFIQSDGRKSTFIDTLSVSQAGYLQYQTEIASPTISGLEIIPVKRHHLLLSIWTYPGSNSRIHP